MFKRIKYIDFVKGIGLLTVMFLHSYNGHNSSNNLLIKIFSSFHMSLFFICSGYFFNSLNYNYKENITKKINGIIKPFIFWSILIGFPFEMYRLYIRNINIDWLQEIKNIFTGNFATFGCWFLMTLFVIYLIEYLVLFICRYFEINYHSLNVWIIHIIFLLTGYIIKDSFYSFRLNSALVGCFFFYFGTFLKDFKLKNILLFFMLILGIFLSLENENVKFYTMNFPNPILNLLTSLLLNTSIICLCKNLYKPNIFLLTIVELLGRNSLIVLVSHSIYLYFIRVAEYFFKMPYYSFSPYVSFIIILIMEYMTMLYCPKFILKTFNKEHIDF